MTDTWLHDSLMKLVEYLRPIGEEKRAFYYKHGPFNGWYENIDVLQAEIILSRKAREALR